MGEDYIANPPRGDANLPERLEDFFFEFWRHSDEEAVAKGLSEFLRKFWQAGGRALYVEGSSMPTRFTFSTHEAARKKDIERAIRSSKQWATHKILWPTLARQ